MSQLLGSGGGGGALIPANFANSPNPGVSLNPTVGVAITAKRSDEILALDQTAAYAFSGLGATRITANGALSSGAGPAFAGTGTWITGGSGTTTKPYFLLEPTGTLSTGWGLNGTAIGVNAAAGYIGDFLGLQVAGVSKFNFSAAGNMSAAGLGTFNSLSAGVTGIKISNVGGNGFNTTGGGFIIHTASGVLRLSDAADSNFMLLGFPATNALQFGGVNAASPVAQTLQAQGSRAGTDSNVGGASLTITSGLGTGTGTRSVLTLQSPVIAASGSGAQTQTTGLRIDDGTAVTTGYTVAALPATPLTGARAHVTDALAPTFLATIVGGGAIITPVFYNGSNWVGG